MEMTTDMLVPATPAELPPLALLTIKPEEYVAQVFAPFRTKLESLKAEADTIHFKDDRMFDAPHRYVDISTTAGMAIALKYRAAFRDDVRVEAEKVRVARKAPILQIGKLLDSTNKAIADSASEYEFKFDSAIKAEERRKADIKAAKERAEAERIGNIKSAIEAIRAQPAYAAGKSSTELRGLLEQAAARVITSDEFAEFSAEAQAALDLAGQELVAMYEAALAAERAAAAAEAARQAELKRLEEQRIEQARITAEQEAKAKALAEAEAELQRKRDAAEAQARADQAERDRVAKAEADSVAAANAAAAKAIEDAAKALAEREAEFQRKQDEAVAAEQARIEAEQLRAQIAADHDEALALNVQFDVDREARRVELQAQADQAAADSRDRAADEHAAGLPAGALGAEALADITITDDLTDSEIVRLVADTFDLTILAAVERLAAIDFDAARELAGA